MSAVTVRHPFDSVGLSRRYTHDQLFDLVGETKQPIELLNGQLIIHDPPTHEHQWILGNLYRALFFYVDSRSLGRVYMSPADMVLAPDLSFQPDILYVATENLFRLGQHLKGPVDLAAEILSPSNRKHDLLIKRACYEDFGVKEYWIVDPRDRRVEVLALGPTRKYRPAGCYSAPAAAASILLSGFTIPVADIFR